MATQQRILLSEKNIQRTGDILKQLREKRGLTQKDILKSLKLKRQPTVTYIENKKSGPSLLHLIRYCDALGFELIMEEKKKTRKATK